MLLPIAIALASHAAAALLGFGGRRRSLSALRTFALVSALAVVLAQLLPDALAGAGLWALLVFGAGAALPSVLGRLSKRVGGRNGWALELGYVGLLVHNFADGIGLGTYSSGEHAGHSHIDVLLALSAHTVPVVAVVALAYQRRRGWYVAIARVGGLALATIAGSVATALVPTAAFAAYESWVTAGVAGLLLHVVAHDWKAEDRPRGARERLTDLLAVVAGIGLVLLGGQHEHGGGDVRAAVGSALLELSLETAPALLLGLVIGAMISAWGTGKLPSRWLGGGVFRQAVVGASIGAPLPICACGVLPLAQTLRSRGAGPALVVAFLLATPELGVETFALTGRLLGWPFAFVRLGSAVLLAVIAALAVHRATRAPSSVELAAPEPRSTPSAPYLRRAAASFDELVQHVAPWTVVGLIAAAYVQAVLGEGSLGTLRPFGLDILVVTIVAVPSYVCAASATPLAAVLLMKGMSPGAVLVGLLLGPATNLATVGFLRKNYGTRAMVIGLAALVSCSWVLALALDASGLLSAPPLAVAQEHTHGSVTFACAGLLALALLRGVWRTGLRAWLASLGESLRVEGGHDHHHDHDDDHCDHDHGVQARSDDHGHAALALARSRPET